MPSEHPILVVLRAASLALVCSLGALMAALIAIWPGALSAAAVAHESPVQVRAELAQGVVPAKGGKIYLHIGLEALRLQSEEWRTPVNLALVLDRSGSMRGPRIAAAKQAAKEALARLSAEDTVSLVAYDHTVNVVHSAQRVRNFAELEAAIDALKAGGRTALYAGVQEGARQLERYLSERRINRVILLSDGLANVGPSSPGDLARLGQKLAGKGVSVTTIGLGLNYNEDLMQKLAMASDGNHAFAETPDDLAEIFNLEFGDTLGIAANNIEIIIRCRSDYKPIRLLGRQGDIDGQTVRVKLAQLTGGTERYLVVELAAAASSAAGEDTIADISIDYMDLREEARQTRTMDVVAARSRDAAAIDASIRSDVMTRVIEQKANLAKEEAIRLRDSGKTEDARKVLQGTLGDMEAFAANQKLDEASARRLKAIRESNAAAASALTEKDWAKTRKIMRYEQHKFGAQQSY